MSTAEQGVPGLVTAFADVAGVDHAVLASRDGLLLACSPELDRTTGDRFAAIVGQFFSLASGSARMGNLGDCEHVIARNADGSILVFPVDDEARLAVVVGSGDDLANVAHQARLLADRVAEVLTPRAVERLRNAAAEAVLAGMR